jgi:hypothetical protein
VAEALAIATALNLSVAEIFELQPLASKGRDPRHASKQFRDGRGASVASRTGWSENKS